MKYRLILLLLILTAPIAAETVTFQDLENVSPTGQRVEIRGFLYTAPDGRLVLASEPNLKSCCLNKSNQITILMDKPLLENNGVAVTLEGSFTRNASGNPLLSNATQIVNYQSFNSILTLVSLACLLVGSSWFFIRKYKA